MYLKFKKITDLQNYKEYIWLNCHSLKYLNFNYSINAFYFV